MSDFISQIIPAPPNLRCWFEGDEGHFSLPAICLALVVEEGAHRWQCVAPVCMFESGEDSLAYELDNFLGVSYGEEEPEWMQDRVVS